MKDEQEAACDLAVGEVADGPDPPRQNPIDVDIAGVRQDAVAFEVEEAAAKPRMLVVAVE
jgi:hypothetical protein